MSKNLKPIVIIVVAVALAASAAVYLSRSNAEPAASPDAAPQSQLPALDPSLAGTTIPGQIRGNPDAPVTILEFGDYQCPTCKSYHPVVSELIRRFPDKVKFEYKHYPLVQIHRFAMPASMAAEAAGAQGKYWEMHDLLFEYQSVWAGSQNAETEFLALAQRLGLNGDQFMQAMRSPELQQRVLQHVNQGRTMGVEGTPTFFVNGVMIGLPQGIDEFVQVIDDQLRTAQ